MEENIEQIQYERMQKGLLYIPLDSDREEERKKHINLMLEYNKTNPCEYTEEKFQMIKQMFGSVKFCKIDPPFYASWGGKNVHIGNGVYINNNVTFVDDGPINIGDYVLIGPGVKIFTVNHVNHPYLRRRGYIYVKPVNICDNVFIGGGAIILPGVTIGENSVIGAGSVVTHDIPPNTIAVGNPCEVKRNINEKDEIYYDKDKLIDWENIIF